MTVYGSQEGVGEGMLASGTDSASLSGMEPVTLEISGKHWTFNSLKDLMGKASPMRSGDVTAGCAASCDEERVAAQMLLVDVRQRLVNHTGGQHALIGYQREFIP